MDSAHPRGRGRGQGGSGHFPRGGRPVSRNKQWVAGEDSREATASGHTSDGERWERGGHRGGRARGRGAPRGRGTFPNATLRNTTASTIQQAPVVEVQLAQSTLGHVPKYEAAPPDNDPPLRLVQEPELETFEEREAFWKELVAGRERERKREIAEGRMDDPLVPKRLSDAITIVGTCPDMCPRFERYRRERESNLFNFETIPGTKRVDHQRAVKQYERAAGDKSIPSDIRPPHVLKKTIDYLFYDLMTRAPLDKTADFVRDRLRACRNDYDLQHIRDHRAIDGNERSARFHIALMHMLRGTEGYQEWTEDRQLLNTLQTLKELYIDQRGVYQSPNELEFRVYHRLMHIRDQVERSDSIPDHILNDPVFTLTTEFRKHVQKKSEPITKTSKLVVDAAAMEIFGRLAARLRETGNMVMIYLVACVLERSFGPNTIEGIDALKGELSMQDIFEGRSTPTFQLAGAQGTQHQEQGLDEMDQEQGEEEEEMYEEHEGDMHEEHAGEAEAEDPDAELDQFLAEEPTVEEEPSATASVSWPMSNTEASRSVFGFRPTSAAASIFGQGKASASVFGASKSMPAVPQANAFSSLASTPSVFGGASNAPKSVFGGSAFGTATTASSSQPQASVFAATSPPKAAAPVFPFGSVAQTTSSAAAAAPAPSPFAQPPAQPQQSPGNSPLSRMSAIPAPAPAKSIFSAPVSSSNIFSNPTASGSSPQPSTRGSSSQLNAAAPLFQPSKPFTLPHSSGSIFGSAATMTSSIFGSATATATKTTTTTTPSPFLAPTPPAQPPSLAARSFSASTNGSRASPPPPLKIDTSVSGSSTSSNNGTPAQPATQLSGTALVPPSPREPPPLERVQPMSLPSTPTTGFAPPSAVPSYLKGTPMSAGIGASPDRGGSGMLSPLVLQTPKTSSFFPPNLNNFSPSLPPQNQPPSSSATSSVLGLPSFGSAVPASPSKGVFGLGSSEKAKGKAPVRQEVEEEYSEEDLEEMQAQALEFERKGLAVRECYERWMEKIVQKAEWIEACKQSDAYSEKVRKVREQALLVVASTSAKGKGREVGVNGLNGSLNSGGVGDKKRRMSASGSVVNGALVRAVESPKRKRARKRVSSTYQERVPEDELVKAFEANRADVERQWIRGSFLNILKTTLKNRRLLSPQSAISLSSSQLSQSLSLSTSSRSTQLPSTWEAWLSVNPDNEATAIYMQRKLDVVDSGRWLDDSGTVSRIPVAEGAASAKEHPGVIVFECSPLEGIDDEIERKYRVLDDCSRLRDVVKQLPAGRYYETTIMFVSWVADGTQYQDLYMMADKLVAEGTIREYGTTFLTGADKDFEKMFEGTLDKLELDVNGERVRALTIRGLFKQFLLVLNPFVMEWVNSCHDKLDYFNWKLYNNLLHFAVDLLNKVIARMKKLCEVPDREGSLDMLPMFEDFVFDDSDNAYEYVEEWLMSVSSDIDVSLVIGDIQSHHNIQQDFPVRAFLDHLLEIAQAKAEEILDSPSVQGAPITHLVLKTELERSTAALEGSLSPLRVKLSHRLNSTAKRSPKRRSHPSAYTGSNFNTPESKRMRLSATPLSGTNYSHYLSATPSASINGQYYQNGGHTSPSPSVLSTDSHGGGDALMRSASATPGPVVVEEEKKLDSKSAMTTLKALRAASARVLKEKKANRSSMG